MVMVLPVIAESPLAVAVMTPVVYAVPETYLEDMESIVRLAVFGIALFAAAHSETVTLAADAAKITSDTFARTV